MYKLKTTSSLDLALKLLHLLQKNDQLPVEELDSTGS